ncbi:MAG: hypothetical protein HYY46_02320 [Deltaproteobacteria bacterium]|nr:hypothetical protein [Deltaproteobacteria bacterium]
MSDESNTADRTKLITALQEIKIIAEECIRAVGERSEVRHPRKKLARVKHRRSLQVDFDKPLRPFVKSYAKGLSGPKKFALLVSWLSKGDGKNEVALKEIERYWNRMTSLLEMKFNRFFPARAKDNDWVESKKKGFYNLRPNWKDILGT